MLDLFLSYLLVYKYAILFGIVFLASVGLPIPATAVIMAAGAFSAQGYFDFKAIVASAFFGSFTGDAVGYSVSYAYGRGFFARIGWSKALQSRKFSATEAAFARYGGTFVFLTRFLATGLGPAVNVIAGMSKMPYRKFVLADASWELLYAAIFAGLGYVFSDQWEYVSKISGDLTAIAMVLAALTFFVAILIRAKRFKRFDFRRLVDFLLWLLKIRG